MNCEGLGRKASWPNRSSILAFVWSHGGKPKRSLCHDWESNWEPVEYKYEATSLHQLAWFQLLNSWIKFLGTRSCCKKLVVSSQPNSDSDTQGIPGILWNPKSYDHTEESPPLDPVLCHMAPVHILTQSPSIFSNIILPYVPNSSTSLRSWRLSFQLQFCLYLLHIPCMLHAPTVSGSLIWPFQALMAWFVLM